MKWKSIKNWFKVYEPYPASAYITGRKLLFARLIDLTICAPITYYFFTVAVPKYFEGKTVRLGPFEEMVIDFTLDGIIAALAMAGPLWITLPLFIIFLTAAGVCFPLSFYHALCEGSPLQGSVGKYLVGYKVVKKYGDPLKKRDIIDKFFIRLGTAPILLIFPDIPIQDTVVVKRSAIPQPRTA